MSWQTVKLGEVCEINIGKTPSRHNMEYWNDGTEYWLSIADMSIGENIVSTKEKITRKAIDDSRIKLVNPNTILLSYKLSVGKVGISKLPLYTNEAIAALPIKNPKLLDTRYLLHVLKNVDFYKNADRAAKGLTLNKEKLKEIEFQLPPLAEQERIAKILDKANEIKFKRELTLAKLDELVHSTFIDIFGESSKNSKGWEKVQLKNFGRISTGNTPPRANSKNYDEKFIEWIKTDNILEKSIYITSAKEYLSQQGAINGRIVKKDALLVACIAGSVDSIGRASLTNREVAFNQQINAIEPNEDINPLFLYSLFKVSRAYLQSHATSGMKKLLSKGDFEKIEMIKPPIALQNKFADDLKLIIDLRDKFVESVVQINLLLNSLQKQSFTTGCNA